MTVRKAQQTATATWRRAVNSCNRSSSSSGGGGGSWMGHALVAGGGALRPRDAHSPAPHQRVDENRCKSRESRQTLKPVSAWIVSWCPAGGGAGRASVSRLSVGCLWRDRTNSLTVCTGKLHACITERWLNGVLYQQGRSKPSAYRKHGTVQRTVSQSWHAGQRHFS